jgi:hypothetical protein
MTTFVVTVKILTILYEYMTALHRLLVFHAPKPIKLGSKGSSTKCVVKVTNIKNSKNQKNQKYYQKLFIFKKFKNTAKLAARALVRAGNNQNFFPTKFGKVIKNTGKEFTFVNTMGHKTIIDITFTSRSLDDRIANWAVNTSESLSDHKRIEFNLEFDCSRTIESRNYNTANWGLFDSIIVRKIELPDTKSKWDGPRLDLEAEKF